MKLHQMKLQPSPFQKIKDGDKIIETRLFDEKRQTISIGDSIDFILATNENQKIRVLVVDLLQHKTFSDLFDAFPPKLFGGSDKDDLMNIYKYYSKEDELKYGVLGIKIDYLQ